MRISFILPGYPLNPVGGYRVVYEYANALVNKGHNVTVIHPYYLETSLEKASFKRVAKSLIKRGVSKLYKPDGPSTVGWQRIDQRVSMLYVQDLSSKNIPDSDIIVATAWETAEYVKEYPKNKGEKYYLIQHYEAWSGPVERVNQTWKYPMRKIVIAKWLMEKGKEIGATNMIHIPNAIDHTKFRLKSSIDHRPNRVAMLYHEADWKGTDDGIQALELAKEKIPNLEAVLFGFPNKGENIPEWVTYIQEPEQHQLVDEIYNGSAVYLCPSWEEGWGLPSAEAMACGCALVSTENGGVLDFAEHEKTALLSPPKNPEGLATNLIRVIKDKDLRLTLANKALEEIQRFDYSKSVELLLNDFEETLRGRRS